MNECEIKQRFNDVVGLNEAKKIYKQLAKQLHPDIGGTDEEFKLLNKIYNDIIEYKIYFSNGVKFDLELEKVISQILHFENINIEVIGSWIWISGDTRAIKDNLKELSFKWASKKKMWFYGEMKGRNPKQKSMDDIKSKYGCTTLKTKYKERLSAQELLGVPLIQYIKLNTLKCTTLIILGGILRGIFEKIYERLYFMVHFNSLRPTN